MPYSIHEKAASSGRGVVGASSFSSVDVFKGAYSSSSRLNHALSRSILWWTIGSLRIALFAGRWTDSRSKGDRVSHSLHVLGQYTAL